MYVSGEAEAGSAGKQPAEEFPLLLLCFDVRVNLMRLPRRVDAVVVGGGVIDAVIIIGGVMMPSSSAPASSPAAPSSLARKRGGVNSASTTFSLFGS